MNKFTFFVGIACIGFAYWMWYTSNNSEAFFLGWIAGVLVATGTDLAFKNKSR